MGVLGGGSIGGSVGGSVGGPPTGAAGGDLGSTFPSPIVDGLQGEPVSADSPSEGDVLTFVAGEWTPEAPSGGLPSQTGNESKVLTTNGTVASWTDTLVDVRVTGDAGDAVIESASGVQVNAPAGAVQFTVADYLVTATGGLVATFGDVVSISTSNGTLELGSTDTATIQSVSADVQVLADSGITLQTTTGIVSVPTRSAGDSGNAAASTEFVTSALAAASAFIAIPSVEPIVIASSPTWTTVWTLDEAVPEGQSWRIIYEVEFSTRSLAGVVRGGSWVLTFVVARSIGSGATVVSSGVSQVTGSFGSMGVQAIVTFATNKLSTQIRLSGGATGRIQHRYRRVVLSPIAV